MRAAVDLAQRPRRDAGGVHVADEHGDAAVLRDVAVGAGDEQPVVGVVRARRPHLLPVDDPLVAVALGARLQAGDVGPGARLREQLAPHRVGAQQRREVLTPLLVGAVLEQRGRADADAHHELARRHLVAVRLLVEHLLVLGVEPRAADLDRVGQRGQAGVGERVLERLAARDDGVTVVVPSPCRAVGRCWSAWVARNSRTRARKSSSSAMVVCLLPLLALAEPALRLLELAEDVGGGRVHDVLGRVEQRGDVLRLGLGLGPAVALARASRPASRRRTCAARSRRSRRGSATAPRARGRSGTSAPPRRWRRCGSRSSCTPSASAWRSVWPSDGSARGQPSQSPAHSSR